MVWMRPAGLPNFRKLWGRINQDLSPGTYIVAINNTYDVSGFIGQKFVVLSTSTFYGGKNVFFAGSFLAFGFVYLLIAGFFLYKYKSTNGKFGAPLKLE